MSVDDLVEDGYRLSAARETMVPEGTTTQVGPGRSGNSTWPGPRPTKGTTGLMNSVEPTPDTSPPPPCPLCTAPACASSVRLLSPSITIGDYRCPRGHIWTTRWLVDA